MISGNLKKCELNLINRFTHTSNFNLHLKDIEFILYITKEALHIECTL